MRYREIIARNNPAQSWREVNDLLLLLEGCEVDRVLEIGTHRGGSARVWRERYVRLSSSR